MRISRGICLDQHGLRTFFVHALLELAVDFGPGVKELLRVRREFFVGQILAHIVCAIPYLLAIHINTSESLSSVQLDASD
jgi:hypothetical protein